MSYIFRHDIEKLMRMKSFNSRGGKELVGRVVKTGFNDKTVTIRVEFFRWVRRFKFFMRCSSNIQVHDRHRICKLGDIICARSCKKISPIKSYYVQCLLEMAPRVNFTFEDFTEYERQAVLYNQELRTNNFWELKGFFEDEVEKETKIKQILDKNGGSYTYSNTRNQLREEVDGRIKV